MEAVSSAWGDLTWVVEAELCWVTDRYKGAGLDQRWCGRAMGPKYVQETVLPSPGSGSLGKLNTKTHALLWAANRLQEMAALALKAHGAVQRGVDGTGLTGGQAEQWDRVVAKFASPSAPICCLTIDEERWCAVSAGVQAYRARPAAAHDFTSSTAQ